MLSHEDADIVQRDVALPTLATVLDPEEFLRALRSSLPDIELSVAKATYVRYKPGMHCLVAYRVAANGDLLDMYAKAHRSDDHAKMGKPRTRSTTTSAVGPGCILRDGAFTVFSIFPHDGKLKSLRSLYEIKKRTRLMQALFPNNPDLLEGTFARVQYKPERRYVARWQVNDEPKAVLKFYPGHGYTTTQQNTASLTSRETLRVAQQLGHADDRYVLAFEWLSGRPLHELLTSREETPDDLSAVGVALAELHAQSPQRLAEISRASEATALVDVAETMNVLCPQHAVNISRLARRLAAKLLSQAPVLHTIHGSFHDNHVMLTNDGVAMLDLDAVACGDPASDLGNFIAHLERSALRGDISAERVGPLTEPLLQGYQSTTGHPVAAHLPLYVAVRLFLLLPNPFQLREPDWLSRTEVLLKRVEELFENSNHTRTIHFQFT